MIFNPKEFSQSVKFAFNDAKQKIAANKFGSLITLSAIILFSCFIFLAIIAPFAYKARGLFQSFISFLPILGIFAAIIIGVFTLFKVWKGNDNQSVKGTIATDALNIAINEAIDSGLMLKGHEYSDCLMGKIDNRAVASFNVKDIYNYSISVIRIRPSFNDILMILPNSKPWPYKLPTNKKLKEIISHHLIEVWGGTEDTYKIMQTLEAAIEFAKAGGQIPYIYIANNVAVLRYETIDIGSVSLVTQEFIKLICDYLTENNPK